MVVGMRSRTRDLAAREARLETLQQQFTASVGPLVTGEDWKSALLFAANDACRDEYDETAIFLVGAMRQTARDILRAARSA